MSVTEHLSVTFSRPWWRRGLLAMICVYPVIGVVALWFDVTEGFGLSLLFDVAQLVLVWGALVLLFAGTSKEEEARYSLDTGFYLTRYRDDTGRVLAVRPSSEGGEVLVGLDAEHIRALTDPAGEIPGLVVSHSVREWVPDEPLPITDVRFEVGDDRYDLPWVIGEGGIERVLHRFNAESRHDYNGLTLATRGWRADDGALHLTFAWSFYYSYFITNMLPEVRVSGRLTYRDLLEPGPGLNDLVGALPENHLGMSCLLRTSDGALVIPRRSQDTHVFKGQLSPSVSGGASPSACRDDGPGYSPLSWLARELSEELPFLAEAPDVFPGGLRTELSRAVALGMTRELRRCGKPEMFFFLDLPVSAERVRELAAAWRDDGSQPGIDHHENERVLVRDEAEVLANLATQTRRRGKGRRSDVVLTISGEQYVVSESLLANLILYARLRDRLA